MLTVADHAPAAAIISPEACSICDTCEPAEFNTPAEIRKDGILTALLAGLVFGHK